MATLISPTATRTRAVRQAVLETANPPARSAMSLASTVLLAVFVCAAGILMQVSDKRQAPAAPAPPAAHHATTSPSEAPRTIALQGTVGAYDPASGMLDLAAGGSLYRVRISHDVASRSACSPRVLLAPGSRVHMVFAAYLDGPLVALAVAPAGVRCGEA